MTPTDFKGLKPGDLVRHKHGRDNYQVTGNYGDRVTAVRTVDLTNAVEWLKVEPDGSVLIRLPYFGTWEDDDDRGTSWETHFGIFEDYSFQSITIWTGYTVKTEIELDKLKPEDVQKYLTYRSIEPAVFFEVRRKALETMS